MTVLATLTYNPYLILTFESYNERYEGSYPDLKFKADVRFKYTGNFKIQANNVVTLGGLSKTISRWDLNYIQDSGWYYLGEINEHMYCNRQRYFEWNASCQGWPNLSGKATLTTPLIDLPSYDAWISGVGNNDISIFGKLKTNPYNLYTLRLYSNKDEQFVSNNLNGNYSFTGLTQKTEYEFHVESYMADCSGNRLSQTVLKATTLENYASVYVTYVDFEIIKGSGNTDDVKFTVHTSDDGHVKSVTYKDGSSQNTVDSREFELYSVPKNTERTIQVLVTDSLDRTSSWVNVKFNTTFTHMEVWSFDGTRWKRGYSLAVTQNRSNYQLCRLFVFDGLEWKKAILYK